MSRVSTAYLRVTGLFQKRPLTRIAARYEKYVRRERLSSAENLDLQWRALRRLLQHAFDTTPFYRRRFEEYGLDPRRLSSPDELSRVPPLTREDLKTGTDDLCSRQFRRRDLLRTTTGGTTDVPAPLFRDRGLFAEKRAIGLRFDAWAGCRPGDKVMLIWGQRSDYPANPSRRWTLFQRLVGRRVWAPSSPFDEATFRSHLATLNSFRPRVIRAFPSPLVALCEWLSSQAASYHRPRSVICTAEPLTEERRATIEATLDCPVHEQYGARDFGMIAGQCEERGPLHLNPHAAYVEYVPVVGGEDDRLHELYVTDLWNYGMPMIRYRINDCAVPVPERTCPCGRGYPLLERITGRVADNFVLPNGDVVVGAFVASYAAKDQPVRKVQFIQHRLDTFEIRYVPADGFQAGTLDALRDRLRQYVGPAQVSFERVDDIPRERSGKTRACISHVRTGRPAAGT